MQKNQIKAFAITNGGSQLMAQLTLFPRLLISLLAEALQRTKLANQSMESA